MTRFARAKGSKSSNEKKPEEATSWAEMKKSMLSKKSTKVEKFEPKREINIDPPKNTEWATLGSDLSTSNSLLSQNPNRKNKNTDKFSNSDNKNDHKFKKNKEKHIDNVKNEINLVNKTVNIKKKIKKQKNVISDEVNPVTNDEQMTLKNKNKKRKFTDVNEHSDLSLPVKKKKLKKTEGTSSETSDLKLKNAEIKKNKKFQQVKKDMKTNYYQKKVKENFRAESNVNRFDGKVNKLSKLKKKFHNKNYEEQNSEVGELIINGEKIPIVKFQGFHVTLEDAERLKKLRSEMIKEGIPKNKLESAIKLERRRAEKALSRLKKSVCFHCRGHGHLLSNCPKLVETENTSTGICYKCGSTEHSVAQCKVIKGSNYHFAECFICKEQGHIARQCPDNPRGLYPQGGACRECGDVTHLRKDCPKVIAQKVEDVVTVGLRSDRNLECLDEEIANREKQNGQNKVKKSSTIKF